MTLRLLTHAAATCTATQTHGGRYTWTCTRPAHHTGAHRFRATPTTEGSETTSS